MSKIYLYNYNNYFNRIIKKEDSLANYGTPIYSLNNTNFNYADGVQTYHDINYSSQDGDYLIVTDEINGIETIISRWFVMENTRNRGGQHRLQLRRDLIADYYDIVITAPMIVNRAMVTSKSSPLLYNSEGNSYNQIKKNEILLRDKSESAWAILYFKKNTPTLEGTFTTDEVNYNKKISTTIDNSIYGSGTRYYLTNANINIDYRVEANSIASLYFSDEYIMTNNTDGLNFSYKARSIATSIIWFNNNSTTCINELTSAFNNSYSTLFNKLISDLGYASALTTTEYNDLLQMNNKYILDSNNQLYKINIVESITVDNGTINSGNCYDDIVNRIDSTTLNRVGSIGNNAITYSISKSTLVINATLVESNSISWTVDWGLKQQTIDSDFNIIAIPYNRTGMSFSSMNAVLDSTISQLLIKSIEKVAGSNLVDIQLFPYCPIPQIAYGELGVNNGPLQLNLTYTDSYEAFWGSNREYLILYIQNSNFTFNIENKLEVENFTDDEVLNYKISNECDVYKIVSPNYNGSFEFSIAKNDGVDYFNIDCSLIPYKPYIHINPNFKGLYGKDWNDSKGLICGGDFSLPKYTTEWANYQLNNKNYQQIFDRQVRNLDFTQEQERIKSAFNLAAGTLVGGIGGGITGAKVGGPIGATIGGTIGSVASGVGGAIDYSLLQSAQGENKSLLLTNYQYQLGNIKAMPDTINKVTPLTFNNKIYPFIEIYSATIEEKLLLQNYLTFKSMNINAFGTIENYKKDSQTFISGALIRLEELNLNSHEANEIYAEIMKGVYI